MTSNNPDYIQEGLMALAWIILSPIWLPLAAVGGIAWIVGAIKVRLFGPSPDRFTYPGGLYGND